MSNLHSNMDIVVASFDRPPIATTWGRLIRTSSASRLPVFGSRHHRFVRNCEYAIGNTAHRQEIDALRLRHGPLGMLKHFKSFKLEIKIWTPFFTGRYSINRLLLRVVTYESFKFNYRMRDRWRASIFKEPTGHVLTCGALLAYATTWSGFAWADVDNNWSYHR